MKKIGAIIQARTGSHRLPGKVLKELPPASGVTVLQHIIRRLKRSERLTEVIVATSTLKKDDRICALAGREKVNCFRGSEKNVLARYYSAARENKLDVIVRITADCPCIDPGIVDKTIEKHFKDNADYTTNSFGRRYPQGLDVEVFNFAALAKTFRNVRKQYDKEHVTPYIYNHPDIFKISRLEAPRKFYDPQIRIALDTRDDYTLLRAVFKHLYPKNKFFKAEDIFALFKKKIKVCILTEGGQKSGFGHIARCLALYQAFKGKKITPQFIVNADESVKFFLQGVKYKNYDWLRKAGRVIPLLKEQDMVILDSYSAGVGFCRKLASLVKMPVFIDDFKRLNYPGGVVLNSSIDAKKINYPRQNKIKYLLGAEYTLLRKEFWQARQKSIKKIPEKIMVSFGGSRMNNMASLVLRFLVEQYPGMTKYIIIAGGPENAREVEELKDKKTKIINNVKSETLKRVMLDSDIAISATGQTLYELVRLGVPVIIVSIAANQAAEGLAWGKSGLADYSGIRQDKTTLKNLAVYLEKLKDQPLRLKKSKLGRRLIDGQGAKRVISSLLDTYHRQ